MDNTTFSLLYKSNELMEKSSSVQEPISRLRYNPEIIPDLQLDELCAYLFDDENFSQPEEFLKILCTNGSDILYRQQIINDIIQNSGLLDSFVTISRELKKLSELKAMYENRKEVWIKYDLLYRLLAKYVDCLGLLVDSFKQAKINSEGLKVFRKWLETKHEKENVTQLKIKLEEVKKGYKSIKGLIVGINVNENCDPKCLTIEKLIYENFSLNGIPTNDILKNTMLNCKSGGFETPLQILSVNSQLKFDSSANGQLISIYLNKKLQKILRGQTSLIKDNLTDFENIDFASLTEQYNAIIFYCAAVKWHNLLVSKKLKSILPTTYYGEYRYHAKECYSPIFALKMNPGDISSNDIFLNKNIYVITGANSAGKTSMLRTIALNQLMFYAGFHVCAEKAEFSICKGMYSSFSTGENIDDSRFGMEVARIQSIKETADSESIVLLNEPFTSTNPAEGVEICKKAIKLLMQKGSKVIAVTHYYELYNLLKNDMLDVDSLLMREVYENEKDRLLHKCKHRLLVQEPDGINFAKEIAEQFGFNVKEILSRFKVDFDAEVYSFLREMKL